MRVVRWLNLVAGAGSSGAGRALTLNTVGPAVEDLGNLGLDAGDGSEAISTGGGGKDEVLQGGWEVEVTIKVREEHGGGEAQHLQPCTESGHQPPEWKGQVCDRSESLGKGEVIEGRALDAALGDRSPGERGGGAGGKYLLTSRHAGGGEDQRHTKPREVV